MSTPSFTPPPVLRTRLIGRDAERKAATSLLIDEGVGLLTLVGTGGVGKTRLALQIAADVVKHYADGAIWVDFSALDGTSLVPATVARAANVPPSSESSIADALTRQMTPLQILLVVDNCEHVVTDVAALVSSLLAACPGLQVLATSRAPLRIRGEHELPVEPLALPAPGADALATIAPHAAIELFVERTSAVRLGFRLDAANAAPVAAICQRLDGLPLAIELAAARCKVLPPALLLGQLDAGLQFLSGGPRDAPARQQTIFDAIAWSYDLLNGSEQRLFRRLGVFAGGCTLDEAQAVAGTPGDDVLAGLISLVENSLVRQRELADGAMRFFMLETIRAFARERLLHDEDARAIHQQHAAYFLQTAEAHTDHLFFATDPRELGALEAALGNARAALSWFHDHEEAEACLRLATAYGWLWFIRGPFPEGRRWLDLACDDSLPMSELVRGRALMWASDIALRQNDYDAALVMAARSVELLRNLPDAGVWLAASLINLGCAHHLSVRDDATAIPLLREALAVARGLGNSLICGVVFNNLAEFAIDRGAFDEADAYLAEAAALQDRLPHAWGAPYSSLSHGVVALQRGDYQGALMHFTAAKTTAEGQGDISFVRAAYLGAALVADRIEALDLAMSLFTIADRLLVNSGGNQFVWLHVHGEAARNNIKTRVRSRSIRRSASSADTGAPDTPEPETRCVIAQLRAMIVEAEGSTDRTKRESADRGRPAVISPADLTFREQEVLALLCQRYSDPEIGAQLYISPRTVSSHVSSIMAKLGVSNRRQAAACAARQGLI